MNRKVPLRSVQTVRIVKPTPVAQVMRCNCQTVYGPEIVFTIRTDREAVFSDRISLSTLDMTVLGQNRQK